MTPRTHSHLPNMHRRRGQAIKILPAAAARRRVDTGWQAARQAQPTRDMRPVSGSSKPASKAQERRSGGGGRNWGRRALCARASGLGVKLTSHRPMPLADVGEWRGCCVVDWSCAAVFPGRRNKGKTGPRPFPPYSSRDRRAGPGLRLQVRGLHSSGKSGREREVCPATPRPTTMSA